MIPGIMLPVNLGHLSVIETKRRAGYTAWFMVGHARLCAYKYGQGAAIRPQTRPGRREVVVCGAGSHRLPQGCAVWNEVQPVRRFATANSLFGRQNSPQLKDTVEFKVCRREHSTSRELQRNCSTQGRCPRWHIHKCATCDKTEYGADSCWILTPRWGQHGVWTRVVLIHKHFNYDSLCNVRRPFQVNDCREPFTSGPVWPPHLETCTSNWGLAPRLVRNFRERLFAEVSDSLPPLIIWEHLIQHFRASTAAFAVWVAEHIGSEIVK